MKKTSILILCCILMVLAGCSKKTVDPIVVEPAVEEKIVLEVKPEVIVQEKKEEPVAKIAEENKKIETTKVKEPVVVKPSAKPKGPVVNEALTATLSIDCKTILNNTDKLSPDKKDIVPKDGIIYKEKTVEFKEGETVYDVLYREVRANKIHMESSVVPLYGSNYIEGIQNLYEFDCGELSGWMYQVNGVFPNYGCSKYTLKDGDVIQWVYTCDLGRDVGAPIEGEANE